MARSIKVFPGALGRCCTQMSSMDTEEVFHVALSCWFIYFDDRGACICNWCHTCVNCWVYKASVCSIQVIFDTEVKMRASTILVASCVLFLVMASLCKTGEGFALSLTARREQLKAAKKKQASAEEDKMRKRLRKLQNRQTELNRKVTDIKKMIKKYKSTHRTKVSNFPKANPYVFNI